MPGRFDGAELIFILLLAILLFGDRLGGKSWQEMADELVHALQRLRQGDPQSLEPTAIRGLTIFGILCIVLALELSWLATQI